MSEVSDKPKNWGNGAELVHLPESKFPKRNKLARLIAFGLLLVICAALISGYTAFQYTTEKAIIYESEKEQRLISSNLQVYRDSLAYEVERIALSEKAYNTVKSGERNLFLDQDLTPTKNNRGDRDVFLILDAEKQPAYAYRQDLPWHNRIYDGALKEQIAPTIDMLERNLRTHVDQSSLPAPLRSAMPIDLSMRDIIRFDGGIGLATVAAIAHPGSEGQQALRHAGYLIWIRQLDADLMDNFESITGMRDIYLTSSPNDADPDSVSVPLENVRGDVVAYLSWTTSAASKALYDELMPYMLAVTLVILVVALGLLYSSVRLADRLVQNEGRARFASLHDALTGLPNRTYFSEALTPMLRKTRMNNKVAGVVYMDLDHFKQINDSLGHLVGDEVICQVAERLQEVLRPNDLLARISGDEFLILLPNRADLTEIEEACFEIEQAVTKPYMVEKNRILTTASLGVVVSPEYGHEMNELLRRADIALYQAKEMGRARHVVFQQHMEERIQMRRTIEEEIERALKRNEFENFYQPIMDAKGERAVAAEALIRWNHPTRGQIAPGTFLHVAEESQLINKIGEWVLETAMKDATHMPGIQMCVNVSPNQLRHPDFPPLVERLLQKYELEPGRIELEVTEEVLMSEAENVGETLKQLHNIGVKVALDDFGTGYSSLSYLRLYNFDKIKIDRSFVEDLDHDVDAQEIMRSLIHLSEAIKMDICVEGIERKSQFQFLSEIGNPVLQGFYFARPMPLTKFRLWREGEAENALDDIELVEETT
ncbi:putative bifunctional diguanylate cyclase/phosphodiesterase [Pseudovibrio sp. SPO723]|uniref:putative bifunctional diguanylate cyclase/phosphodiesterase n=1 Tax=Nesiotobacter zosterae TaxID=392721 RepID=UPI0029C394B4|nr:EAL domain-containing protein [Pseudovibrio sp. SPO723]MDX5594639.1 EAL domain-containing protein [Pseudovibrio sp. SPO723]